MRLPALFSRTQSSFSSGSMGKEPNSDVLRQFNRLRIPSSRTLLKTPMVARRRTRGTLRRRSVAIKKTLKAVMSCL